MILRFLHNNPSHEARWCGPRTLNIKPNDIDSMPAKITSESDPRIQGLIGGKFNRLTLIRFVNWRIMPSGQRYQIWECRCDCGTIKMLSSSNFKKTQSCGCSLVDKMKSMAKHGGSAGRHPLYRTWKGMRQRCLSEKCPGFKDYGGRGITICKRWDDFSLFALDMGPKPSPKHQLGRIDNNGNYEPGNVRWETPMQNMANTRHNRIIEHDGKKLHLMEWARITGLLPETIALRIKLGWPMNAVMNPHVMTPSEKSLYGHARQNHKLA